MPKPRLPAAVIVALLSCGTTPAAALVMLDAAPQLVADQATAPDPRPAPVAGPVVSSGVTGWAIGIAGLGIAGIVLRRRPLGRVVSS